MMDGLPGTYVTDVARQARASGDATAITCEGRRTTYRQLEEGSNRVANAIIAAGIPRQARVAILDFNSDSYLEALIGIPKAACVPVGINFRLAHPEVAFILKDSGARLLLVGSEHYRMIESILPELDPSLQIVALQGGHERWPAYDAWRDAQPATPSPRPAGPDDDVVQLYSSGTTGLPKGACHTLLGWKLFRDACLETPWGHYDGRTVMLAAMPLFHVAALNTSMLALCAGAHVVVMRKFDPGQCLTLIERERVTDGLLAPAVLLALLQHPACATTDLSSYRMVAYGAAPISEELLAQAMQRFHGQFVQLYGMTENLGISTYLPPDAHDPGRGKLRSAGIPYRCNELRIAGPDGAELPRGQVGEVLVRCPAVMRCYWKRPEDTAETVRDGWLHTGDAGYVDADGFLYIMDRVKDMIVSGGENIYPAEVENAVFSHPAVADVAVIGVPDEKWGEAVKAVVVPKPGQQLDADELLAFVRKRIAGFKVPRSVDIVAALPRNASGKVLKRDLREPYWKGRARRVN
jgi:fatty-acyl-CoA synthase